MRLVIDVRSVGPRPAGIGQYTRSLLSALSRVAEDPGNDLELELFGDRGTDMAALAAGDRCRFHLLPSGPVWHLAAWRRFGGLGADVYHSPSSAVVPLALGRKAVITVPDLVPALFPSTSTAGTRLGYRLLRLACGRVGRLIAISETTRVDLDQLWRPRSPVQVVLAAPRELPAAGTREELAARFDLAEDYFLSVGTLEPRKNLATLVEAYARLTEAVSEPPLLIVVGASGWGDAPTEVRRAAESLGARLRFPGFVDDAGLSSLYAHARALIHPARYEGFGLPPLEAMAAGTAVAAAAAGALPEVLADAAAFFDPTDPGALSRLLEQLAGDDGLIRELEDRGRRRAALFSWDKAARETVEVYRAVAESVGADIVT